MLKKCHDVIINLLHAWSLLLFTLITLISLFYRTFIPRYSELAEIKQNRLFLLILFLALWIFYFVIANLRKSSAKRIFFLGVLAYTIFAIYLFLSVSGILRNDAVAVYDAARGLNNGDFSYLEINSYLYRFPHQLGLVTYERIILALTGAKNAKIFFLLNFIMIIAINYLNWKITKKLFDNEEISKISIVISFLFLPQFFSILFVYGLVPGLFFSMIAIYCLIAYFEKRQLRFLAGLIIALICATVIRNNYIILVVTISIILILDAINHKAFPSFLGIIVLFTMLSAVNTSINSHYKNLSNGSDISGTPHIAWIAMGLDDNPKSPRLPGWYDESIDNVYVENKGDFEKIKILSQYKVKERLDYLTGHPKYAWDFFATKVLSTWTEGLFQSIWSGPAPALNQGVRTFLWKSVYNGKFFYKFFSLFSTAILFLIYFGSLVFLFYLVGSQKVVNSLIFYPYIYFSGGFLFHLIWETKSQYAYPYIVLLFPVAAFGLFKFPQLKKTVLWKRIVQKLRLVLFSLSDTIENAKLNK